MAVVVDASCRNTFLARRRYLVLQRRTASRNYSYQPCRKASFHPKDAPPPSSITAENQFSFKLISCVWHRERVSIHYFTPRKPTVFRHSFHSLPSSAGKQVFSRPLSCSISSKRYQKQKHSPNGKHSYFGWLEGIEPSFSGPQPDVLPLNDSHHNDRGCQDTNLTRESWNS